MPRCWGVGCQPQGGPAEITAPGPRCSGPGSVLGVPMLLPCTLPATACTGTVPADTGGTKGRDCHRCDEQWCHTGQRCALTQPWGLWLGFGIAQHILVSQPLCQGSVVPGWNTPRAGACPWHGCWWGSGGWGCGLHLSASQSPMSCPVPIPSHGLEAPGSVLVYLSEV